jgi:hypothetical protein
VRQALAQEGHQVRVPSQRRGDIHARRRS